MPFATVIVYGTSWPRTTLIIGVVFVIATDSSRSRSSGMWLLKIWLVPGTKLESNVTCR
jgi:hypothetical protein